LGMRLSLPGRKSPTLGSNIMSNSKLPEWRTEHVIRSYEIDLHRTARLPVICCLMQDAAFYHAKHFGLGHTFLGARNLAWVLARQRISIEAMPRQDDRIHIRTWPSGQDRLFFYRDFEITGSDGRILILSSTAWFVIDLTLRERRHPETFLEITLPAGPRVFTNKLGKLKSCVITERGPLIHVSYGDLDFNGHVNNVRYIEWILNSLPLKFHREHSLYELEVNYLAEAYYGHQITVGSLEIEPLLLAHDIRVADTELFRARTRWRKR